MASAKPGRIYLGRQANQDGTSSASNVFAVEKTYRYGVHFVTLDYSRGGAPEEIVCPFEDNNLIPVIQGLSDVQVQEWAVGQLVSQRNGGCPRSRGNGLNSKLAIIQISSCAYL